VGEIFYLTQSENDLYSDKTVRIQQLFNWLARMPNARVLGEKLLAIPEQEWNWATIGSVAQQHLYEMGYANLFREWKHELARQACVRLTDILEPLFQNPFYFISFPAGGLLAGEAVSQGVFRQETTLAQLTLLNTITRRHLFTYGLYKIEKGAGPIMQVVRK